MKKFTFTAYSKCAGGLTSYAVNASASDGLRLMASTLYFDHTATILIGSASDLYVRTRLAVYGLFAGGYRVEKRGFTDDVTLYHGNDVTEAVKAAIDAAEEVL